MTSFRGQGLPRSPGCSRRGAGAALSGILLGLAMPAVAFRDPVDTPAAAQPAVGGAMLAGVAQAGSRLVVVGARGVIAVSDNEGRDWSQVPSPVSSDLVAVQFATAQLGWATGHDGVVLNSRDGGRSWTKVFDGRQAIEHMKAFYAPRAARGDASATSALKLLDANGAAGGDLPWLSLWFSDAKSGFIVGPFGMVAATADGGVTWQPWIDRIDNPDGLHLNAVRQVGGDIYIAAEKGVVFKLNRALGRFVRLSTGYEGTFFGITGDASRVLAFGLRGTCFQSLDGGSTWERVATGLSNGIAAGAVLSDGRAVLVGQGGQLAVAEGSRFAVLTPVGLPLTDTLPLSGSRLLMVGLRGARVVHVTQPLKL